MLVREWVLDVILIFMTLALCVLCTGTQNLLRVSNES
jgi:hypothetical protein